MSRIERLRSALRDIDRTSQRKSKDSDPVSGHERRETDDSIKSPTCGLRSALDSASSQRHRIADIADIKTFEFPTVVTQLDRVDITGFIEEGGGTFILKIFDRAAQEPHACLFAQYLRDRGVLIFSRGCFLIAVRGFSLERYQKALSFAVYM